jgi:DNA-binding CsgD family transcriptional regulator
VRSAGADELQILGVLAATRILAGRRHEGAALITDRVLTQWLERAEQLGSRDAIDLAVGGQPLLWSEQHHRAQQFCSAMADACRRRGSPYGLANVSNALSESLWWTGRWPEAMGVAEEALTLCQQIEQPLLVGPPAAVLARLLACQGDEARCQELVSTALSSAEVFGHVYVRMMAHHAAGLCDLSARRPKEAMASLLKCEQTATQIGLREVCIVPYGADLVEALIQSGEDQQAKRLLALHVKRSRDVGSSWGLATAARCQAMLSEDEDADILFKEALVGHPVGSFEEGRTRLSWGEHLRRRNQRRLSRGQLERAATIFDGLGAQPWYRRASSELHAVGARTTPAPPAAMKTLTAKEIQVALAVARGMSNREVAAALFASPKTIEYHLRQVYAKLGVSRRTQLAHYLISTVADRQPTNIAGDGTAPVVTHPE